MQAIAVEGSIQLILQVKEYIQTGVSAGAQSAQKMIPAKKLAKNLKLEPKKLADIIVMDDLDNVVFLCRVGANNPAIPIPA